MPSYNSEKIGLRLRFVSNQTLTTGESEVYKIVLAGALASLTFYEVTVFDGPTRRMEGSFPQRSLKGDRLPIEPACSPSARLHDNTECGRKQTPATDHPPQVREVRIVSVDLPFAAPSAFANRCDCTH